MHRSPCCTSAGRTRSSTPPSAPRSSACCSSESSVHLPTDPADLSSMSRGARQPEGVARGARWATIQRVVMFGVADEMTWSDEFATALADEPTEIFHSLDSLHPLLVRNGPRQFASDYEELADVLKCATGVFAAESSLLEVPVPCVVALRKLQFAERVHVVRGNHEEESLNRAYSFYDVVCVRFNEDDPSAPFCCRRPPRPRDVRPVQAPVHAPAARRVGGRPRAGGLSSKLRSLAAARAIRRPIDDFDVARWSATLRAPSDAGFRPNLEREPLNGIGQRFAADAVRDAAERLSVDLFVRGHQAIPALSPAARLCALLGARYKGSGPKDVNMGACLEIAADMRVSIKQLQVSVTYRRLGAKRSRKHTPRFVEKTVLQ
ncbi:Serine/threonine-protein phosphatase [Aphelenchoides fujianensis]|nr:Serine/threonine-protein phosphatase [Aphelenchoides fujianensis]